MQSEKSVYIIFGIVAAVCIVAAGVFALNLGNKNATQTIDSYSDNVKGAETTIKPTFTTTMTPTQSAANIPLAKNDYKVTLETTEGTIVLQLNKATPKTTGNFVSLAEKGFYNGTIFHRTIEGFMIQGGDPKGDGTGGPGYKFEDEQFTGEYTRGTIAMANAGPNTNGSQFFIMHADYALPKNYTIFGKVISGIEVVDKIATAPVTSNGYGENSKPVNPVKILSAKVEELN